MSNRQSNYDGIQALLQEVLSSFQSRFVEGISEFEIITLLKQPPYSLFDEDALRDSLMLFQTHFVLFHSLYRLRNEWREQKVGELDIAATQIKLLPSVSFDAALQTSDTLADYYLDWNNMTSTDQAGVDQLLGSFWQKMAGIDVNHQLSGEALNEALSNMQLETLEGLTLPQLKQHYRKLQHANHPDKGGSVESSQLVLQAYTALYKHLSSQII
ncbi:DNA-J related domain-containing protein [Glaciecola sp. MF2-115]|uniref:DNA-J related domain-containing protein n=1 Tax=Glaciecola sp. MF2-115 TaxID=3384827 RepID=UPI00399F79EF